MYQNYNKGGNIGDSYGLTNATAVQRQQLSQLQTRMDQLSSEITYLTNKFGTGSQESQVQAHKNKQGLREYLVDIKKNNNKIKNIDENITNIVNDSDIVVLQKNYNYLFWTILATGTVLISMNMIKKQ
jgi:nitrate reductase beta subunit